MTDLVTVVNPEGGIRYASPSFLTVLGYDPVDIIGRHMCDLIHPDDVMTSCMHLGDGLHLSSVRTTYRLRHANGADINTRGVGGHWQPDWSWREREVGRGANAKAAGPTKAGLTALAQAVEKARRLADSLSQLGGTPPPRLMDAEEIAHLVYGLADPVRAHRYPLAGTLLDRVRTASTLRKKHLASRDVFAHGWSLLVCWAQW